MKVGVPDMNLTKEQKLEMVSKAIDAGFGIELRYYDIKSDAEFDERISIFEGLVTEMNYSKDNLNYTWCGINKENAYDDGFEATIFIDSLRGENDG